MNEAINNLNRIMKRGLIMLNKIIKGCLAVLAILIVLLIGDLALKDKFTGKEDKKEAEETIVVDLGEDTNLSNYLKDIDDIDDITFSKDGIFDIDSDYNIVALEKGETELIIHYDNNTTKRIKFESVAKPSVSTDNINTFYIDLNSENATMEGTTRVYEKYGAGVYLDAKFSKRMTASANNINPPIKDNYDFVGYYTGKNGAGLLMINKDGYITTNFKSTSFNSNNSLYAKWTGKYVDKINGDRCLSSSKSLYYITYCQPQKDSSSLCKYTKINGKNSSGTVVRKKLSLASNCTDTINGNRCSKSGDTKTLYYITACHASSVSGGVCNYTKVNGKASTGTVARSKLSAASNCNDVIEGNRCLKSGSSETLYYITTCQPSSISGAVCNYTKVNGKASIGTVARNKLSAASNCTTTNDGNVVGATGFSALNKKAYLRKSDSNSSLALLMLESGHPFKILGTNSTGKWWKVSYNGKVGYVENRLCLINLPDYIPSITYNITNANSSIYVSSGYSLPNVTGKKLYKAGKVYNQRLGRNEYIVPVTFGFAKKILIAQRSALKEGYSLKIYDAYRPKSVADSVKNSLDKVYNSNSTVRSNINKYGYNKSWFISQKLSAHSVASAIDVTLVSKSTGKELTPQTKMHELSVKAAKYSSPQTGQMKVVSSWYSTSAKNSKNTLALDRLMLTNTGLTNLASEWWHFQDNASYDLIKSYEPNGLNFQPTSIVSSK